MTTGIHAIHHVSNSQASTQADSADAPSADRAAPLTVTAHGNDARHGSAHYDWMDFHTIHELSQQW